jgi:hypothetical protein
MDLKYGLASRKAYIEGVSEHSILGNVLTFEIESKRMNIIA